MPEVIQDSKVVGETTKEIFEKAKVSFTAKQTAEKVLANAKQLHVKNVLELRNRIRLHLEDGLKDNQNASNALKDRCLWKYADEPGVPFIDMLINVVIEVLFGDKKREVIPLIKEASSSLHDGDFAPLCKSLDIGISISFGGTSTWGCTIKRI